MVNTHVTTATPGKYRCGKRSMVRIIIANFFGGKWTQQVVKGQTDAALMLGHRS